MRTRKNQKAVDYLERIWDCEKKILNKKSERQMWIDMATGITSGSEGVRVQTSRDNHSMEKKVIQVVEIDEEIEALKAEINSIIRTIEKLNYDEYDFLHKVYVQKKTLKEIHTACRKSYSWATTMHSRALASLQHILDE